MQISSTSLNSKKGIAQYKNYLQKQDKQQILNFRKYPDEMY